MARMLLLLLAALAGCRHDRVHLGLAVETWTPAPTRVAFQLELEEHDEPLLMERCRERTE